MISRRPTWKQESPILQLRVLIMSISGNLSNGMDGIIEPMNAIQRSYKYTEELDELSCFIARNPHSWESGEVEDWNL